MNRPTGSYRSTARATALFALVAILAGPAWAQEQVPTVETQQATGRIVLAEGQSTILTTDYDVVRLAVTDPEVANALVVEPREVLIDGRKGGTVSLVLWGADRRTLYDVVVDAGGTVLERALRELVPGEDIQAKQIDEAIVLSGSVSSEAALLRALEVASASSPKSRVINMLQLPGLSRSQQVLLQVRFAEVSRRAMTELGISMFTGPTGFKDFIGRGTTQQFPAPDYEDLQRTEVNDVVALSGKMTFSDFLNLFVFDAKRNIGAVIKALEQNGYFQSLAEPNLIAYNGQEASFLAGGEFPVPVLQGTTGAVTVLFKEFGVRLTFLPVIAGDVIRLKVTPEVSSLDFVRGLSIGGYDIPSLITRRADTNVELRDGQSFVIAGLLNNLAEDDRAAIPFLSKIPIIGNLFKSKVNRSEETELMVLITPRLVRALDPDEVPPLPTDSKRFIGSGIGSSLEEGGGLLDGPPVERGSEAAEPAKASGQADKPKPTVKRK